MLRSIIVTKLLLSHISIIFLSIRIIWFSLVRLSTFVPFGLLGILSPVRSTSVYFGPFSPVWLTLVHSSPLCGERIWSSDWDIVRSNIKYLVLFGPLRSSLVHYVGNEFDLLTSEWNILLDQILNIWCNKHWKLLEILLKEIFSRLNWRL